MHRPISSHWLWHPAWMPSLPNSGFNLLSCSELLYRNSPHSTWALKLTLDQFPTPCRFPLHLIWTLILPIGPSPLTLTTYRPPNGSSTELSCNGKGKRWGGSERPEETYVGSCSKQNDYGWNHSLLTACGHVSTPIWSLSSTFRACARLETSMNQLSLGSSFISLFSDSQRFLMFSFINFIMPLKFLLIMCPVYLWVGNEKNFICISLAHHVAELPLNTTFKHLFFCQIYVITF